MRWTWSRHDNEGVEFVMSLATVVLEGLEEEFGVGGDLKEVTAWVLVVTKNVPGRDARVGIAMGRL
jgi:hypothetical protein